jgi:hypothetical protein
MQILNRISMRNIITFIFLTTLHFFVHAQNVPNGDFEKWRIRDHYKPAGMTATIRNAERSTDSWEGNYSLKLSNTFIPSSRGYRSYAFNVDKAKNIDGVAFTGDALSIAFWTKYDLAYGDTARVYVILRDKGVYKGKVDFRFTGTSQGEWVKYSVPIEWTSSHSVDSVWINLYSYADYGVDGDGYVLFDDIHFTNLDERQMDFENHGFENWDNIGINYPNGWRSLDLLYYDTYYSFFYEPTVFQVQGEDAFQGESSMLVKNAKSNGSGGSRYGYCFLGLENNDYYTPFFSIDTFKYLQGYYKYIPDGDDTASINLRTWGKGAYKSNDYYYLGPAAEWTFFAFPINYNTSAIKADSAALIFYSGKTTDVRGPNSSLYLDNIELVMEPKSLGIEKIHRANQIYPNPFEHTITIQCYDNDILSIYNGMGKLIAQRAVLPGKNQIHLTQLSSGLYFIKTHKQSWTTKVIKR